MSIGFVIVTFNSASVLRDCLASIPAGHPIIVVDNASRDSSLAIAESFGAQIVAKGCCRLVDPSPHESKASLKRADHRGAFRSPPSPARRVNCRA